MATFAIAYRAMEATEGGWTIDNGGRTYKGISSKGWVNTAYPDKTAVEIFRRINAWIAKNGMPRNEQILNIPGLEELVQQFYRNRYWNVIYGDSIQSQTIANFIYDFYVNSNSAPGKIMAALGLSGSRITPQAINMINAQPAESYILIRAARKRHIDNLGSKKGLKKYYAGWKNRLNTFPETLA